MKKGNYSKAYVEVREILNYMQEEDKCKIPKDFLDMMDNNMDRYYTFNYDETKTIDEQDILRETRALLAYVYLNYLGTDDEKAFYNEKFNNDIMKLDEVLAEEKIRI